VNRKTVWDGGKKKVQKLAKGALLRSKGVFFQEKKSWVDGGKEKKGSATGGWGGSRERWGSRDPLGFSHYFSLGVKL